MSRLTRDGTAEPVSRDQILRHARGQGNVYFPCSADHEQDWQPYPVDPYSAICDDHTYIHTYYTVERDCATRQVLKQEKSRRRCRCRQYTVTCSSSRKDRALSTQHFLAQRGSRSNKERIVFIFISKVALRYAARAFWYRNVTQRASLQFSFTTHHDLII